MQHDYPRFAHRSGVVVFFASIVILGFAAAFLYGKPPAGADMLARSAWNRCTQGGQRTDANPACYGTYFQNLSYKRGSLLAFQTLLALQQLDPTTHDCHGLAHAIGKGTFGSGLSRSSPSYLCAYGEIHGIVEAALSSLKKGATFSDALPVACGRQPSYNCVHLLGKVVLLETRGDAEQALAYCRATPSYSACASGVFGEGSKPLHLIAHGVYSDAHLTDSALLKANEELCQKQTGAEALSCWEELAHAIVRIHPAYHAAVFAYCDRAQNREAAAKCKTHAIADFLRLANFDLSTIEPLCRQAHAKTSSEETACLAANVMQLLFREPGKLEAELSDGVDFCTSIQEYAQAACFTAIGETISQHPERDPEAARTVCQKAPEKFFRACLGTAPLK